MAFTDTIATIPFAPTQQAATGFLPPLVRGMGHVLYLLGCEADEAVTVTPEQATAELTAAREHWNARSETNNVSSLARERSTTLGLAISEALNEYTGWTPDQRTSNLRDLSNRIVAYTAELDRELIGLTGSDAGSSL